MSRWMMLLALLALVGCDRPPPPLPADTARSGQSVDDEPLGEPDDPRFIGRIWVAVSPRSERGSMKVFLPDRTLLMHVCGGSMRISRWGARADRIRWIEDAIPIEATISLPRPNELELQLPGAGQAHTYVAADESYSCP